MCAEVISYNANSAGFTNERHAFGFTIERGTIGFTKTEIPIQISTPLLDIDSYTFIVTV